MKELIARARQLRLKAKVRVKARKTKLQRELELRRLKRIRRDVRIIFPLTDIARIAEQS